MTNRKNLPRGLGALIVIKQYGGKLLKTSVVAFNLDSFGNMWVEVNSEAPRSFVGSSIDEWASATVSEDAVATDFVPGDTRRVAFLIDRFSDEGWFYRLSPPLMGVEHVVLARALGKYYLYASDSTSYVADDRPVYLKGEFETNADALNVLGYQEIPREVTRRQY